MLKGTRAREEPPGTAGTARMNSFERTILLAQRLFERILDRLYSQKRTGITDLRALQIRLGMCRRTVAFVGEDKWHKQNGNHLKEFEVCYL